VADLRILATMTFLTVVTRLTGVVSPVDNNEAGLAGA